LRTVETFTISVDFNSVRGYNAGARRWRREAG
jgi:hypothetical protein